LGWKANTKRGGWEENPKKSSHPGVTEGFCEREGLGKKFRFFHTYKAEGRKLGKINQLLLDQKKRWVGGGKNLDLSTPPG